jgi:hypothetical protein
MFGWEWREILTMVCIGGLYIVAVNWLIRRVTPKRSR